MKLFGYYALHSFWNQLRKLFRSWVLIFVLVCGLLGGLIGFGAAALEDAVQESASAQEETTPEYTLTISRDGAIELAAGAVCLGLLVFEVLSADKNGSKIFLPADVNLLFSAPMKPQSVLMFRLATQLGTALAASVYMMFQLPNMVLNEIMTVPTALATITAWFFLLLLGKLQQVLLYVTCASRPGARDILRRAVYGLLAAAALGFGYAYRTGSGDLLQAADRFFNAPISRWIPVWGWLKGMIAFTSSGSSGAAFVCAGLLAGAAVLIVWATWHIEADFYEDAMAKSEETAAKLERAKSEKVVNKRKKDRSDSLKRDGLNRGWGASVYLTRPLYNRFRFAHFGFFTKTMETYLAAAAGIVLFQRLVLESVSQLPVVLAMAVLVFFRALGNPLEEDTRMDFFRLIPEPAWKKLSCSLLAGCINTALDVLLPLLLASLLLPANPLKLLVWLPVILTVDMYCTTVGAFMDLSLPGGTGFTLRTMLQVSFVYFGLLPDAAIVAAGIVYGHTAAAAAGAAALNLLLTILFFSLTASFVEPKGRDHLEGVAEQNLQEARRRFSAMGMAAFAYLLVTTVFQVVFSYGLAQLAPAFAETDLAMWVLTFVPQYCLALPTAVVLLKRIPALPVQRRDFGTANMVRAAFISILFMYAGNLLGAGITALLSMFLPNQVNNPLTSFAMGQSVWVKLLVMVVLAPLVEEYIFRKSLIDRMHVYGGKTAVVLSALMFGLFHGNLSQFFYAFGLGLVFGYLYLRTGKLRYSVALHMAINFLGGVFAPGLLEKVGDTMDLWAWCFYGYAGLLILGSIAGFAVLMLNRSRLRFEQEPLQLPEAVRFRTTCLNPGMLLLFLLCLAMICLSIFM